MGLENIKQDTFFTLHSMHSFQINIEYLALKYAKSCLIKWLKLTGTLRWSQRVVSDIFSESKLRLLLYTPKNKRTSIISAP